MVASKISFVKWNIYVMFKPIQFYIQWAVTASAVNNIFYFNWDWIIKVKYKVIVRLCINQIGKNTLWTTRYFRIIHPRHYIHIGHGLRCCNNCGKCFFSKPDMFKHLNSFKSLNLKFKMVYIKYSEPKKKLQF